jgi:MFS family permease
VLGVNGVFGNLGVAFAALIAGALAYWFNWRVAFLAPGVLAIAAGIGFAALVPRSAKTVPVARRTGGLAIGRTTLVRVFAILTVSTICGGIIFNATTVSMPKVFDERLTALTQTTLGIGVLVSLVYTFAAMAQLIVGYLIDRHSIRSVFVPVVAMQVPLLFFAGSMENYPMLAVSFAMMFFVFGQVPINDAMVAAYTDEKWRSRVFAVRYVVSFGASACSVPLVAYIYRQTGDFRDLFFALAGMACTMLIAAACMPPQVQKQVAG